MTSHYFFIFEILISVSSLIIIFLERKNRDFLQVLFFAFLYGMILEALNIYMSNAYYYGDGFLIKIFGVPGAIGLGWLIVYYISSSVVEKYPLNWWQSPFLFSLVALSFDFFIDIVAIRLGFWQWKIPLNEEWFGVPYENFFGWFVVVFLFSLAMNFTKVFLQESKKKFLYRLFFIFLLPVISSILIVSFINISATLSSSYSFGQVMTLFRNKEYFYSYDPNVQFVKSILMFLIIFFSLLISIFFIYKNRYLKFLKKTKLFPIFLSICIYIIFWIFNFIIVDEKNTFYFFVISLISFLFIIFVTFAPIFLYKHCSEK